MLMANKSKSNDCEGMELSAHKVITVYALAVATVAVAVAAIALRYAVVANNQAKYLMKEYYNDRLLEEAKIEEEADKNKKPVESPDVVPQTTTEEVTEVAE